jgi:hypothetical protein
MAASRRPVPGLALTEGLISKLPSTHHQSGRIPARILPGLPLGCCFGIGTMIKIVSPSPLV